MAAPPVAKIKPKEIASFRNSISPLPRRRRTLHTQRFGLGECKLVGCEYGRSCFVAKYQDWVEITGTYLPKRPK
jgi:hypothetical protein